MSRKILGLDIGSHSIKAVLIREGLGKIEPVRFIEKPVTNGDTQALIKSIFQEGRLNPDIVISSVAGNNVSVHYLNIPFSDEAKISRVVPNEVENLIPFPIEDMIIDQVILSKGNGAKPNGGSTVCVALIKKNTLQNHINTLKGASVDTKVIEIESLALYHAFMQWYKIEETVALLDIGAARTNLCIVSKGKPALVRTFNRGGNNVTSSIKEFLGISLEEAEGRKLSSEIILSEGEGDVISTAIKKGLSPLVAELLQSLHAYEINNNDNISKLYISGGGARLHNLDRFLYAELNMDIETFSIPNDFLQKLQGGEDANYTLATGIGLALCGARKKHAVGLNFKKGEQISRKETKVNIGKTIYIIAALISVIILGFADFYSKFQYRQDRYDAVKAEMRKVYMETFPEAKNIVDEVQQSKSAVEELRKKVEALGGGSKGVITSLDTLNTLSEKVPKDMQVDVDDIMIDKSKIRVQGETDSFESVEKLKKEFETVSFFKKVDVSDAKLSADQKKVKFRIIIDM
ncbi:MAG: pilus assembly protein PilM [Nitrospirota bacterium]